MKYFIILFLCISYHVGAQPFLPPDQLPEVEVNHAAPPEASGQAEFALWQILATYDIQKKVVTKELKEKLNQEVTVGGFIIPLDFEADKVSEFLLVPYVPSCAHVPPPSENQIVHVKLTDGKKVEPAMMPMVIKGKLSMAKVDKKKKNEDSFLPDATFEIKASSINPFSN